MEFGQGGKRKLALKTILGFLAEICSALSDGCHGIRAIRFMNGADDLRAANFKRSDEIDKVVDNHIFEGLTCIGTSLMRKILMPFVFTDEPFVDRRMRHMDRPLLVMVITDGGVSLATFQHAVKELEYLTMCTGV